MHFTSSLDCSLASRRWRTSFITLTSAYSCDNNGNMKVEDVSGTKTTYAYDRENRMTLQQVGTTRTT